MSAAVERADTEAVQFTSAFDLYRRAHRIEALAKIIMDCTAGGGRCADTARAERLLLEIGGIAGKDNEE